MDHKLSYNGLSWTSLVHWSSRKEVQTTCTNSGGRGSLVCSVVVSRLVINWKLTNFEFLASRHYVLGLGFWGRVSVYNGDPQLAWPIGWANWGSPLTPIPVLKKTDTAWLYQTNDYWPCSFYLHDMPSSTDYHHIIDFLSHWGRHVGEIHPQNRCILGNRWEESGWRATEEASHLPTWTCYWS